jgi:hypothetical protein
MSALDEERVYKTPCPECGGEVEHWFFGSDCRGNESSSGIQCKNCKKEFTPAEWAMVEEGHQFIEGLRARKELLETADENITVPPGITHFLIKRPGQKPELRRMAMHPARA